MGKMTNQPLTKERHSNLQADTPQNRPKPAPEIKWHGQTQLLCHPLPLDLDQQGAIGQISLDRKARGARKTKVATQLPPRIAPKPGCVLRVRRAFDLRLVPIAHVMRTDHPKGARHTDQSAELDLRPARASGELKTVVNEQTVHAHRMAST